MRRRGARTYVAPANDWRLIAGVATYTVEMLEAVPDLDVLIVPAGGGSGLSGACLAGKSLSPRLRVIGVQAAGAPVVYETWRSGQLRGDRPGGHVCRGVGDAGCVQPPGPDPLAAAGRFPSRHGRRDAPRHPDPAGDGARARRGRRSGGARRGLRHAGGAWRVRRSASSCRVGISPSTPWRRRSRWSKPGDVIARLAGISAAGERGRHRAPHRAGGHRPPAIGAGRAGGDPRSLACSIASRPRISRGSIW